ncbi:MAG: DUF2809 domain-containing protein [Acidobacteriaceae bacterium]|nr:DUF2809 domain-containing protein [Acidobacteriaceae bacterium]
MPARRTHAALALIAVTTVGILWRYAPLHLPRFAWKYGGSMLWAVAVYCLCATILPRTSARRLALLSAAIALAVEFSRLMAWPPLDAFRHTLAGKLLLGAIFSPHNIAAYWLGILLAAMIDARHALPADEKPRLGAGSRHSVS